MARPTLNLGIVAHVDAGKTTLTERLLFAAGVIDTFGSVDSGTTRTDTLALERQRGITIKSAVVSLDIAGVTVNLIDTPGHPDFISEVERVLSVLDGAVLVISAVEGVQPQARILLRALHRLGVPTLLFVNKIDRSGADPDRVLDQVGRRLAANVVAMGTVSMAGSRGARFRPYGRLELAERVADHHDGVMAAYLEGTVTEAQVLSVLRTAVHPVFFGSAMTGDGIDALMNGLVDLLPTPVGDPDAPVAGRVFKIDRDGAYVRLFSGRLRLRQRLTINGTDVKPTSISVAAEGRWVRRDQLAASEIGRLAGLTGVRIGDAIGPAPRQQAHVFAPPTMETTVAAVRPHDEGALRAALAQLAEQDPLINVRVDETGREVSVSLYGEVQKEVIGATLADEFGVEVTFRDTTTLCVERPTGHGEAVELLNAESNPFNAQIGLRVEPAPAGSGVEFRMAADPLRMPLHLYRNATEFGTYIHSYVQRSLDRGLHGWPVIDCVVTMTDCWYPVADGPPSRRGPDARTSDFRNLTPLVLRRALERAGTAVCEPTLRVALEIPAWSVAAVFTTLGRLGAAIRDQSVRGELCAIGAVVTASSLRQLQRLLPALTSGEGVLESAFDGYRQVTDH